MTTQLQEIDPCPSCEGTRFQLLFTKKERDFWRCCGCGVERQYPLPTNEQLEQYYSRHYESGRLASMVEEQEMIRVRAERRVREVRPHLPPGRWLDVGCSSGAFVRAARGDGIDARGIELAAPAVANAQASGLPVEQSRIEDHQPDQPYDGVTAFDVIEHVQDPVSFVKNAERLLLPSGKLALTVPNLASVTCRLMGKRWYFYIPDGHLYYFGPRTLRALLEAHGFEVERIVAIPKAMTPRYTLGQLQQLNPLLAKLVHPIVQIMPDSIANMAVPVYVGEILAISRRAALSPRGSA